MAVNAKAQIFVLEDESSLRDPSTPVSEWPVLPQNEGQGNDSFTPIGSGIFLLIALGGVYLVRKRICASRNVSATTIDGNEK